MPAKPLWIALMLLAAAPVAASAESAAGVLAKISLTSAPTSRGPSAKAKTSSSATTTPGREAGSTRSARPPSRATAKAAKAGNGANALKSAKRGAPAKKGSVASSRSASPKPMTHAKSAGKTTDKAEHPSARRAGPELSAARALLRAVKQDPVRRRYKHEWEKAIGALERAARGRDRGAALLEAARARYALYRFSSDEADRDRALALAKKASAAGERDASTFIAAVRREAGDDAPPHRPVASQSKRAAPAKQAVPAERASPKPSPKGDRDERAPARAAGAPAAIAHDASEVDEPPDTDPVLDRILAQLAEDPHETVADVAAGLSGAPAGEHVPATPPEPTSDLERILQDVSRGGEVLAQGPRAGTVVGGAAGAAGAQAGRAAGVAGDAVAGASGAPSPGAPSGAARGGIAATPPPSPSTTAGASKVPAPASGAAAPQPSIAWPDLDGGVSGRQAAVADGRGGPIRRIVIDPGHGGHDPGAIGPTRVREKDVVLAIARRLARKLEAQGFEAVLTRDDDRFLALAERTALANAHEGDLFVSIHANAHPRRNREGVETWVLDVSSDRYASRLAARENGIVDDADSPMDVRLILADLDAKVSAQASRRLARVVQQELTSGIRDRFGPVRDLGVKSALFYVLLGARMPAVLVETSFISNRAEEKRLASPRFQDEVASALTRAIDAFAAQQARIAAR